MKNSIKRTAAAFGAALMLTSALAAGASAALPVIVKEKKAPAVCEVCKAAAEHTVVCGAKYYTATEADLTKFFDANSYSYFMEVGDIKVVAPGVVFYTSDASVVSVDSVKGALTAKAAGTASVYAYTEAGVPFLKLNITVRKPVVRCDKLNICANKWYLNAIGAKTDFKVDCPTKYTDIVYDIVYGKDLAEICDGKLVAKGYGPVVVRAYSKKYPTVYGDTFVYVGKYDAPVYDGYWHTSGKDVLINKLPTKTWNKDTCTLNGWIKTDDGIMLPVIKYTEAATKKAEGGKKDAVLATGTLVSLEDIFAEIYGDYLRNPVKPTCKPGVTPAVKPEHNGTLRPVTKPVTKPGCGTDVRPNFKPDFDFKPGFDTDLKPDFKPETDTKPECDCKHECGCKPVVKPQVKPQTKPQASSKNDHASDVASVLEYLSKYFAEKN
ncbi:MAG: hypothetical protein E7638_08735 [Ruminococcaceae bacterium]|nr:hypothetical protein [Oscillospiraceae bacterium]